MKTVEFLFEMTGVSRMEVAARSGLELARIEAIADGRWTPTPKERESVAAAFGVPVDEISWGHTVNPRNVRYHRFGLKDSF
jgi:transcriptional regulator with XRE-family HTH domain